MVGSQTKASFHGSLFPTFSSRRMETRRMKPPCFAVHFPTQKSRFQEATKIFCRVFSYLPLLAKRDINCCNILGFSTTYGCPYVLEDDDCEEEDDDDDDDDCEDDDDDDDECECDDDDDDDDDDDCEEDDDDDDDDDDCEEEDDDDDDDDDCEEEDEDDDDDDDDDECECDG